MLIIEFKIGWKIFSVLWGIKLEYKYNINITYLLLLNINNLKCQDYTKLIFWCYRAVVFFF